MPPEVEAVLFAGPTLYGWSGQRLPIPPGIDVRPPAKRGDITLLAEAQTARCIILVDGLFHQSLAVGHAELRDALEGGWHIWGLGSMGAIRAYEMRHLGMRGYGQVYRRFTDETDFQDDEVALLHEPEPPYKSGSEPMIHLRVALAGWLQKGWLPASAAAEIESHLKSLWYGERTLRLFESLVTDKADPGAIAAIRGEIARFDPYRVKTSDLAMFLREEVWRAGD
jgi:hypothetical protein